MRSSAAVVNSAAVTSLALTSPASSVTGLNSNSDIGVRRAAYWLASMRRGPPPPGPAPGRIWGLGAFHCHMERKNAQPPLVEVARRQCGVVTRAQLAAAGLTDKGVAELVQRGRL